MILNVGIDIVQNNRIKKIINNNDLLYSIFHEEEIDYCNQYKNNIERFSGTYAAKEAVSKALKCSISIYDVIILRDSNGAPYAKTTKPINCSIKLSISHEKLFSVAIAIVE